VGYRIHLKKVTGTDAKGTDAKGTEEGTGTQSQDLRSPQGGQILTFSLGYSRKMTFVMPPQIHVVVEKASTSAIRTTQPTMSFVEYQYLRWRLPNTMEQLSRLRSRSPYTGTGVLFAGRSYPKLKATKKAKK
jgi:hypothetical protein